MDRGFASLFAVNDTVGFCFHQPAVPYEAFDLDKGAGGLDVGEELAVSPRGFFPARDVCEHDSGTNDVLEFAAGFFERLLHDLEASLGLPINVIGVCR